ncbi:unnamed protein product [Prunus armeniaca]|uniref:CCHC-type domain-containing protein n=1 Tax=Prunus armeniaca TaxID=36596 RepID=A0A6J5V353_PRUAR|nr:unnamed protein product [Prunus armeniaca]
MDSKRIVQMLETLTKQVTDLTTRFEERSRLVDRRFADIEASIQHDEESVKLDAPNFNGELNPKAFLDWLATMDCYFAWHDMSEARKVRLAKIKLLGQAGLFWTNVETQLKRAGEEPIVHWVDMKERLKQKYVPFSYQQRLLDQWQTLRQGNMPVIEYIGKFEEFMFRCDVREDQLVTLSRFKSGLSTEIQRELILHNVNTLERAFEVVPELERYLKSSNVVKQTDSQKSDFRVGTFETPTSKGFTTTNLVKPADEKGALVDIRGDGTTGCYRCQGFGHIAVHCPTKKGTRNLCASIDKQADNEGEREQIYEPQLADKDLEDDFGEAPHSRLAVLRCTLTLPKNDTEDWRRTSIFHTYIKSDDKKCKVIIDNGSCINVVSTLTVSCLGLSPYKLPEPHKVAWMDDTSSIPITQRCQVPIEFSSYKDHVWCDVVAMDVNHVLLGRPWIYDHNVTILGRENICSFIHKGKSITLKPLQPKLVNQFPPNKEVQNKEDLQRINRDILDRDYKLYLAGIERFSARGN